MPQTSFQDKKEQITKIVCSLVKRQTVDGKIVDLGMLGTNVAGNIMNYLSEFSVEELRDDNVAKVTKELEDTKKQLAKMRKAHDDLAKKFGVWT